VNNFRSEAPAFEVQLLGIPELDDDHLVLGRLLAELEEACARQSRIVLAEAMDMLAARVRQHFVDEICWMKRDGYANFKDHEGEHDRLLAYLEALRETFIDGLLLGDEKLIRNLREWVNVHIALSDSEYAEFVLRGGE
jgi:hemerythrin